MGQKKGVARRLEIPCSVEGDTDKLIFTGPDDDGDINAEMDIPNEPEVGIVIDRKRQEEIWRFFGKALGKRVDDEGSED